MIKVVVEAFPSSEEDKGRNLSWEWNVIVIFLSVDLLSAWVPAC